MTEYSKQEITAISGTCNSYNHAASRINDNDKDVKWGRIVVDNDGNATLSAAKGMGGKLWYMLKVTVFRPYLYYQNYKVLRRLESSICENVEANNKVGARRTLSDVKVAIRDKDNTLLKQRNPCVDSYQNFAAYIKEFTKIAEAEFKKHESVDIVPGNDEIENKPKSKPNFSEAVHKSEQNTDMENPNIEPKPKTNKKMYFSEIDIGSGASYKKRIQSRKVPLSDDNKQSAKGSRILRSVSSHDLLSNHIDKSYEKEGIMSPPKSVTPARSLDDVNTEKTISHSRSMDTIASYSLKPKQKIDTSTLPRNKSGTKTFINRNGDGNLLRSHSRIGGSSPYLAKRRISVTNIAQSPKHESKRPHSVTREDLLSSVGSAVSHDESSMRKERSGHADYTGHKGKLSNKLANYHADTRKKLKHKNLNAIAARNSCNLADAALACGTALNAETSGILADEQMYLSFVQYMRQHTAEYQRPTGKADHNRPEYRITYNGKTNNILLKRSAEEYFTAVWEVMLDHEIMSKVNGASTKQKTHKDLNGVISAFYLEFLTDRNEQEQVVPDRDNFLTTSSKNF